MPESILERFIALVIESTVDNPAKRWVDACISSGTLVRDGLKLSIPKRNSTLGGTTSGRLSNPTRNRAEVERMFPGSMTALDRKIEKLTKKWGPSYAPSGGWNPDEFRQGSNPGIVMFWEGRQDNQGKT